ncbi:hypothetical protein [Ruania zhangjianzhongii]|uniref:hypothetical protein n=1 Tax=Ruania zhangjianzhongii TaxID=2603206 RepID=UPI00143D8F01|nr:hypothetical protein [Ruania zhangjianzhongii]
MNIEEWLQADAQRDAGNPLEARLGGLVDRVRRRRRRRAATQAAGAVTVVAAGLVVWQVGGPWDRPAPPPATDPPVPAPTEEQSTAPVDAHWCGAGLDSIAGDAQILDGEAQLSGDLTLDITIRSEHELTLSPAVDLAVTAPGSNEVIAYSEGAADGELALSAGEGASLTRGLDDLVLCEDGFSGTAELAVGTFSTDAFATDAGGTWQLADPIEMTFENGEITATRDESGEDTSDDSDASDDESESPDSGAEISAPESYEPTCGQAWEPPTGNTGWDVTADFDSGPYQASPDGSTGGLSTELTLANTSAEELTADTYTQVVLVQDGTVVSPAMLGSDHVVETSLPPGAEITQSGGHQLWDVCDDSWNGVGPSVPAGAYTAYVLLLDAGPYWDSGERAVLAVTEGQTIEVTE